MKFHLVHGSTESESSSCQTDELSLSIFSAVTDSFWRSTHQLKHMTTSDNRAERFNSASGEFELSEVYLVNRSHLNVNENQYQFPSER